MDYKKPDDQEPTEQPDRHGDGVVRSHPAFGMIGVSRMSGGGMLFGSPILHNGCMAIRLHTAVEYHDPNTTMTSAREIIAEVHLSEAQWAKFVSSPNVGDGVPCTVRYMRTGDLLDCPGISEKNDHQRRTDDIRAAGEKMVAQYQAAVDALEELSKRKTVSKADLHRVRQMFLHPVDYAGVNAEFHAKTITGHMEHVVSAVKSEIDAYVTRTAMRFPQIADLVEVPAIEPPPKES